MQLEGKVAELLTIRELVINIGAKHGVSEGMAFAVLPGKIVEITDPDTGESLGRIERVKVEVRATEVYDRFTICETYRTRTIPATGDRSLGLGLGIHGIASALEQLTSFGPYTPAREVVETLKKSDEAPSLPAITPSESYVQIGDRVRLLGDNELPEVIEYPEEDVEDEDE